jgi:hypothetical protein
MEKNHPQDFENYLTLACDWPAPAPYRLSIYNNKHYSFQSSTEQWPVCELYPISENVADENWISMNLLICL